MHCHRKDNASKSCAIGLAGDARSAMASGFAEVAVRSGGEASARWLALRRPVFRARVAVIGPAFIEKLSTCPNGA
jgi:hypothetical protein